MNRPDPEEIERIRQAWLSGGDPPARHEQTDIETLLAEIDWLRNRLDLYAKARYGAIDGQTGVAWRET
jgi:hypothetical protein